MVRRMQPRISCGWLICNHVLAVNCDLSDCKMQYKANCGTTLHRCYAQLYKAMCASNTFESVKITRPSKTMIIIVVAYGCISDNLFFGFYEQKRGVQNLHSLWFKLVETCHSGVQSM